MPELPRGDRVGVEAVELPGLRRQGQFPGGLEVAVDAVLRDGLANLAQVLRAEPLEQRHLIGEPVEAVADAVREARGAEAAVAPGGGPSDGLRLKEHDVEAGVPFAGKQRGPQAGKAAADDRQVSGYRTRQGRGRLGRAGLVEPERPGDGASQGPRDGRIDLW